jgi:hypothetical protein
MGKKVVINRCFGGFALSLAAKELYLELTKDNPKPRDCFLDFDIARDDPTLIAVIEQLGRKACSGSFSNLKVISIPDDVLWEIQDFDGVEWISEKHRRWGDNDNDSDED